MNPMKIAISAFGLLAAASFSSLMAQQPVVLTVDVARAATEYYKVQEFAEEMKTTQEQGREKIGQMNEEGQALMQEYQELVEQAGSDILTTEAREEATEDAKAKAAEIQQKQAEIENFVNNMQRSIEARNRTQMSLYTKDIKDVIDAIAEERGATLVFDLSGASRNGMPTVIYSSSAYEITDQVVERINATKGQEEAAE